MREWLTVIIVLLILGVLLDGWRRMRQSKRQSIKMSLKANKGADRDIDEGYGSELPNGGARVVGHRDEDDTRQLTRNVQESFGQTKTTLGARIPEQVALNLDEDVPMLMDSVEDEDRHREPSLRDDNEPSEPSSIADEAMPFETQPEDSGSYGRGAYEQGTSFAEPRVDGAADLDEAEPELEPEEVLVINVMSVGNDRFRGSELLDVLLECGMRYGDMQIFHRHHGEDGEGPLLFSMVNMVVPGTFDLNTMDQFETPGVSLFMTLPMNANSMEAFNIMADTAKAIASRLGGELKDEHRSVMTAQTIEHCRHRIREFERKQLSRA